jgi:hypothetical protein
LVAADQQRDEQDCGLPDDANGTTVPDDLERPQQPELEHAISA